MTDSVMQDGKMIKIIGVQNVQIASVHTCQT